MQTSTALSTPSHLVVVAVSRRSAASAPATTLSPSNTAKKLLARTRRAWGL